MSEHNSKAGRPCAGRIVALALLGLLVVWLGVCAYRALGTVVHGNALAQNLRTLWESRSSPDGFSFADVQSARVRAGYLERDLSGLARWASPPVCWLGGVGPGAGLGRFWQLACDGLELSSGLASTAHGSLLAMERETAQPAAGAPDPMRAALAQLARERARLEALLPAAQRVGAAAAAGSLSERYSALGRLAPGIVNGFLLAPELLGGDQSRVYVVILQNTDELRPTGGFIGSVIVAALQGHRLASLQFLSSYEIETRGIQLPDAPGPLAEYMSAPGLVFRDANWSPDFPTSAEVLGALYSGSRGPVDGIVAVDSVLLTRILYAIGPVPVPQYGITVTGDNLVQVSEEYWENPLAGASLAERADNLQDWLEHRKDFGGDFIDAGKAHLMTEGVDAWLDLASTLLVGIEERHLQFWSLSSPTAQSDLSRAGWSGEVLSGSGDFVMAVDANVGYNKVDRRIERGISYHLGLESGAPVVTLTLTYTNKSTTQLDGCVHGAQLFESYEALTQQCYWNYVRVLVPQGARFLEMGGSTYAVDVGVEAGHTSFGTMIVVPPGTTGTLTYVYRPPDSVAFCDRGECSYSLTVQKQPGTQAVPLRVSADGDLSQVYIAGTKIVSGPVRSFEAELQVDREIVFRWRPSAD